MVFAMRFAIIFLLSCTTSISNAASFNFIRSRSSFKCIDVETSSRIWRSDAYILQIYGCNNERNQMFVLEEASPGLFRIRNQASGSCLGVRRASRLHGANVELQACHDQQHQLWRVEASSQWSFSDRRLVASHSNQCLQPQDGFMGASVDGTAIVQGHCQTSFNDEWVVFNASMHTHSVAQPSASTNDAMAAFGEMFSSLMGNTPAGSSFDNAIPGSNAGRIAIEGECVTELHNVERSMDGVESSVFCASFLIALNMIIDSERCEYEISLCDVSQQNLYERRRQRELSAGDGNPENDAIYSWERSTNGEGQSNDSQLRLPRQRNMKSKKKMKNRVSSSNAGECNNACRTEQIFAAFLNRKLQSHRDSDTTRDEQENALTSVRGAPRSFATGWEEAPREGNTRMLNNSPILSANAMEYCGALVKSFSDQSKYGAFSGMDGLSVTCGGRLIISCAILDAPMDYRKYNFVS